jgi:DNA processing protein
MQEEKWHQLALTMVPDLGPILRKKLIQHFEKASSIFSAKKKELAAVEGIGDWVARQIKIWDDFSLVEDELLFIEKNKIQTLFLTDDFYPQRLLNCYDSPTLLYWKGNGDLNTKKTIAIIGTRNNTNYGKQVTETLIKQLPKDVLVISGLAYGIDAIAHKAALNNHLQTIGVLGHGLDDLYPAQNKSLAKEILEQGGLLTEFKQKTKPDKHNFPRRNRVVAGLADATLVIETDSKGGSMITADLAFNYNKEVFAVPGRLNDAKSNGCLQLIQQNKAAVYTDAAYLLESMGWTSTKKQVKKQLEIFALLSPEEQTVVNILASKAQFTIDELCATTHLSSSKMAGILLSLELQNVVQIIPGKMIGLV